MGRLAKRIGDPRLLRLIRRYLEAGVMANGVVMERQEGTPQGGPLSPLFANVLLDEVDKKLEGLGHAFCRYADDCNVYVKSRRAGERVMETLRRIYGRLRLRVNEAKSAVGKPWDRKFLGFCFYVAPGKTVKPRVSPQALAKLKERVRELTARNAGRSIDQVAERLRGYLVGWKGYFQLAQTPKVYRELDEWLRHRLRVLHLKNWKHGTTTFRELRARGLGVHESATVAAHTRRWWRNAAQYLHLALPNSYFDALGVPRLAS